ncbi:MAG TPA: glutathione S-transferase family protein [Caldimonas sp.]|jgi:glutathione S-transferase
MLKLHYFPGNASLIVHIVLEEIGAPFALEYVDRAQAAHKSPAYLALNPNGLIPVLVDEESVGADGAPLVLYETAAICMHLADVHPAAGLLPPLGTRDRANAYKWIAWLASTLQSTLIVYSYPERWADDAAGAAVVRAKAEAKIGTMLDQLDAEFLRHGGPWLLGTTFSIADPYAFVLCRWTRGFGRPARSLPQLQGWLGRMLARPAVQRAFATEKLAPPFV